MHSMINSLLHAQRNSAPAQTPPHALDAGISDAQALFTDSTHFTSDTLDQLRAQVAQSIAEVKHQLAAEEAALMAQATSTLAATNQHAHAHPWRWVAGEAVTGFTLGWLSHRPR